MTTKDEVFSAWAPSNSVWSPWVKPVLFAYVESTTPRPAPGEVLRDLSWCPSPNAKVALVVDLPGVDGVVAGIALAKHGYRPIPLYNAVPLPAGSPDVDPFTGNSVAIVDVHSIVTALPWAADILIQLNLASDAPPAFLLDANRTGNGRNPKPDEFDNRSVAFTTDFPSANFLASRGVQRAVLIQRNAHALQTDLAHCLYRWQDAGFDLRRKALDSSEPLESLRVAKPPWYRSMFQRALLCLGLHRCGAGGFGGWMPDSAAGG